MSECRFVLVDFTHMNRAGCFRLYESGRAYVLPRAIALAATKRELVANQRPPGLGATECFGFRRGSPPSLVDFSLLLHTSAGPD